jgi:hypothetical protein
VIAVMGALLIGAAGADASAYAATGNSLILGRVNHADRATVMVTGNDAPALGLQTGSGPPMVVSSRAKVPRLNADRVDGRDASALGVTTREYVLSSVTPAQFHDQALPGLKVGQSYVVSYSIVATFADPSQTAPVQCALDYNEMRPSSTAFAYGVPVDPPHGSPSRVAYIAGTGLLTVNAAITPNVRCTSDAKFIIDSDDAFEPYVLFTRINRRTQGTASPAQTN